jgi:hypothetical protein
MRLILGLLLQNFCFVSSLFALLRYSFGKDLTP